MTSPSPRTVYFVGAGATRADFLAAPLGDQLLDAVLSNGTLSPALRTLLAKAFDPRSVALDATARARPRLDDVLTLLETAMNGRAPCPPHLALEEVRDLHRLLLAGIGKTLEDTLGTTAGAHAARLVERLLTSNTPIVTTNYDIVFDNVLYDRQNVNYGVSIRSAVWSIGAYPAEREDEARRYRYDSSASMRILRGQLPLLKLNGSLNWLYCPRCDEMDVSFHEKAGVAVLTDPRMARCSHGGCTARYQALLVGPSLEQRYENRILAEVWARAERAFAEAEELVVIGYSLPEADYLIRAMLTRHFARRSEAVTVYTSPSADGPYEDEKFTERYRRVFPECDIDWGGFAACTASLEQNLGILGA